MKFFEQMDPIERRIMVLETVAGSASLEGHYRPAEVLIDEANSLRVKQVEKTGVPIIQKRPTDRKAE